MKKGLLILLMLPQMVFAGDFFSAVQNTVNQAIQEEQVIAGYLSGGSYWEAAGRHGCSGNPLVQGNCYVVADNFDSCDEAYYKLLASDCCKATNPEGRSIGFELTHCVPLGPGVKPVRPLR